MKNYKETAKRILSIIIAIILLQTLCYKFTAAPESVYIFDTIGLGAIGRIGIGILELIASILIIRKRTMIIGALMSFGIIAGAVFSHLTILGIELMGDGGSLFFLALIVFFSSLLMIILDWKTTKSFIIDLKITEFLRLTFDY